MRRGVALGALGALAAAIVVLVRSPTALAGDASEPVRVVYSAAATCPTEAAFLAALHQRTELWRIAGPGEPARVFDVTLRAGRPSHGLLRVREPEGRDATREVTADTCAEVMDVVVLAVAIAIDPRVAAGPLPGPVAAPTPPPAAPPSQLPSSPPSEPPAAPLSPTPPPRPAPIALPPGASPAPFAPPPHDARPRPPLRLEMSNALRGGLATGVAPVALLGVGAWVEADLHDLWPGLSPALRLGFEEGAATERSNLAARVSFAQTTAALDVCPQTFDAWRLSLRMCAHGDLGVLRPHATEVPAASTVNALWLDVGASGSARLTLASPVFLEVDARLLCPVTRDHYRFLPSTDVYDVPAVSGALGVSVGARIP